MRSLLALCFVSVIGCSEPHALPPDADMYPGTYVVVDRTTTYGCDEGYEPHDLLLFETEIVRTAPRRYFRNFDGCVFTYYTDGFQLAIDPAQTCRTIHGDEIVMYHPDYDLLRLDSDLIVEDLAFRQQHETGLGCDVQLSVLLMRK